MVNLTTVKATTACPYWSVHAAKSLSTGRPVCAILSRSSGTARRRYLPSIFARSSLPRFVEESREDQSTDIVKQTRETARILANQRKTLSVSVDIVITLVIDRKRSRSCFGWVSFLVSFAVGAQCASSASFSLT